MNSSSFARFLMAPFAASVEVFLRKNYGALYWSYSKFIGGIFVIGLFRMVYGLGELTQSIVSGFIGGQAPANANWMYGAWVAFLLMGSFHFIIQYYNEAVEKRILSTSMGESHLFGVGKILLALINRMVNYLLKKVMPYLPQVHRSRLENSPLYFSDYQGFTFRVVEPLCIFILSQAFSLISGIVSFWLLVASVMLALHSSLNLSKSRELYWQERDDELRRDQATQVAKKSVPNPITSIEYASVLNGKAHPIHS